MPPAGTSASKRLFAGGLGDWSAGFGVEKADVIEGFYNYVFSVVDSYAHCRKS